MKNRPLAILISVFFFWGFVAASNDILIPVFKEKLHLLQWQAQMISLSFYVAYTVGSLIYFLISKLTGGDILNRIGYKNGIALGLVISAVGTLLFYPAAETASFPLMISGLFIVGLGFSLQQTAANPLAIVMGDPKKGSQRLSLAGGVNNIGTTLGPLLVSFAIFGSIHASSASLDISSVKIPYLILGLAFIIAALVFKFSSIPDIKHEDANENIETGNLQATRKSALHYPQLWLGMIAIFVYVGVEVSTAGNLSEFMRQKLGIASNMVSPYISLFWASLMVGRWTSSVGTFNINEKLKLPLKFIVPYLAFGFFLLINKIADHDLTPFYLYAAIILILIFADLFTKGNPVKQLLIFSILGIAALLTGILSTGMVSVYAFISVGLFCSTLWPCIFTLSIAGLGKHTTSGASFLVMMIFGGGVISWLQGYLSEDKFLGIQWSFLVGVCCFIYLAFYAWRSKKILSEQGISY